MRRHHSEQPGEIRERDQQRMRDVYSALETAGIPLGDDTDEPAYVRVEMPHLFHAVDLRLWITNQRDGEADEEALDALADRIDTTLWAAGYLVHRKQDDGLLRAYKPQWGGDLPEVCLTVSEFAESILGIKPPTWRGYVSRGQAPEADGEYTANAPYWYATTIDRYRSTRPGRGARTDLQ